MGFWPISKSAINNWKTNLLLYGSIKKPYKLKENGSKSKKNLDIANKIGKEIEVYQTKYEQGPSVRSISRKHSISPGKVKRMISNLGLRRYTVSKVHDLNATKIEKRLTFGNRIKVLVKKEGKSVLVTFSKIIHKLFGITYFLKMFPEFIPKITIIDGFVKKYI